MTTNITTYDPTQQAFQNALNSFKADLKDDKLYAEILQTTTIDQVYDATDKLQAEQALKGHLRHLSKIDPFLERLRNYASVIEVFMQTKPDVLALIWGPIKLILQWANNLKQSFDAIVDTLAEIGALLPEFDATVQVFGSSASIKNILALFYKDILDFYRISLTFFRSSRRNYVFEAIWPRQREKIETIKSLIQRHAYQLQTNARVEDMLAEHEHRKQTMVAQERADAANALAEFDRIRISVSPQTYESKLYACYSSTCAGTGGWLMRDPGFENWLDFGNTTSRVVWLQGIPGAGKTILSGSIIKHTSSVNTTRTLYALLSYAEQARTSALSILHSLIFQLAISEDLQALIRHSRCDKLKISLDDSKDLLRTMLLESGHVYLVIDGVDEIQEQERARLLKTLLDLIPSCPNLKLLISSRAESDIGSALESKAETIRVDCKNAGSIQAYVNSRITDWFQEFQFSKDAQREIKGLLAPLAARSKGMFLYAKIVLNTIQYLDMPEIRGELEILPDSLDEAYGRVLTRIENLRPTAVREKALRLLGWIGATKTPLTVLEMEQMLLVKSEDYEESSWDFTPLRIIAICGPIVEILDYQVHFVHFTVKEYLFNPREGQQAGYISEAKANFSLATCCITYLLQFHHDDYSLSNEEIRQGLVYGAYRFHDYAYTYWYDLVIRSVCVQKQEPVPEPLLDLLRALFSERSNEKYTESDASEPQISSKFLKDIKVILPEIYQPMCDVAGLQQSFSTRNISKHRDPTWTIRDPLTISNVAVRVYQQIEGIVCKTTIHHSSCHCEKLKSHFGPRLFRCAFMDCPYRRLGFDNRKSRNAHMQHHDRPMKCQYPGCEYENGGFLSRRMFEDHIRLFHRDETQAKKKISGPVGADEIQPLLFDLVQNNQTKAVYELITQDHKYIDKFGSGSELIVFAATSASPRMLETLWNHPRVKVVRAFNWYDPAAAAAVRANRLDNLKKILSWNLKGKLDILMSHEVLKEVILYDDETILEQIMDMVKEDLEQSSTSPTHELRRKRFHRYKGFINSRTITATANQASKEILLISAWNFFGQYRRWDTEDCLGAALYNVTDTTCSIRLAKYLLDKGAPLEHKTSGMALTPLHRTARRNTHHAAKLMEFLLLRGANPLADTLKIKTQALKREGRYRDDEKPRRTISDEAGARNISKWLGVTWDELVERTKKAREDNTTDHMNEEGK